MKLCVNCSGQFSPIGAQRYCPSCRGSSREKRVWVAAQKSSPCTDCQRTWPAYVMQFDHLPGCVKLGTIAWMTSSVTPLCVLQAEVAKCELVCMNCHAIRTRERGNYVATSLRPVGPVERERLVGKAPRRSASLGVIGWGEAGLATTAQGRHWPAPTLAEPVEREPPPRKGVPPVQVYVSLAERRKQRLAP